MMHNVHCCDMLQDTEIEPMILEITDTGKSRLSHGKKIDVIVESLFPHPIRFREVCMCNLDTCDLIVYE